MRPPEAPCSLETAVQLDVNMSQIFHLFVYFNSAQYCESYDIDVLLFLFCFVFYIGTEKEEIMS